jgi:hypothetical protein
MRFGIDTPSEVQQAYGRKPDVWFGARCLFHPCDEHDIEFVHDRRSVETNNGTLDLAVNALGRWIDEKGLALLRANPEYAKLDSASTGSVEVSQGGITLRVNPQGSHGYLYLGCWRYWPDGCAYWQAEPDPSAKWTNEAIAVPPLDSEVTCRFNNGDWTGGIVKAYCVEHGWQGIEIDFSSGKRPAYHRKQDPVGDRVLMFGCDVTGVNDGTS